MKLRKYIRYYITSHLLYIIKVCNEKFINWNEYLAKYIWERIKIKLRIKAFSFAEYIGTLAFWIRNPVHVHSILPCVRAAIARFLR